MFCLRLLKTIINIIIIYKMKKAILKSVSLLMAFMILVTATPVWADGVMIEPYYGEGETVWDQWTDEEIENSDLAVGKVVNERSQQAFIDWDKKTQTEKMMILVNKERTSPHDYRGYERDVREKLSENALYWIVPIRSNPEDVKPHHYAKFSETIENLKVEEEGKNRLNKLKEVVLGLQIWPLLGKVLEKDTRYQGRKGTFGAYDQTNGMLNTSIGFLEEEVVVYERIESFGVRTEIISATSSNALAEYLEQEQIRVNQIVQEKIDSYLSSDYCFAVSKVVDHQEKGDLGLMLEFKTEEPFYPMYLTSAYEDKVIKVDVMTRGVVSAKMGKRDLKVSYLYLKDDFSYGVADDLFFEKGDVISQITLNEQAYNFEADMYFSKDVLASLLVFVKLNAWGLMILLGLAFSWGLASFLFKGNIYLTAILNILLGITGLLIANFAKSFKFSNFKQGFFGKQNLEENKFSIFGKIFNLNKICLFMPISFLLLIPILVFGGYEVQDRIEDFFEMFFKEEELAGMFFLFAMPISFLISLSTLLLKKIISALKVPLATRILLADLLLLIVNIFQFVLIVTSIILFVTTGAVGWIVGACVVLLLVLFMHTFKYDDEKMRLILNSIFWGLLVAFFFNPFVALLGFFTLYPYLISVYVIRNIQILSDYYEEINLSEKEGGECKEGGKASGDLYKIFLFSLVFVIGYVLLNFVVEALLLF